MDTLGTNIIKASGGYYMKGGMIRKHCEHNINNND